MSDGLEPRPSLFAGLVLALDLIADHVVMLDPAGRIVHANVAWQRFALDNGDEDTDWVGVDYVAASAVPAARAGIPDPVTDGVRDVLGGRRDRFVYEYDCHAPDELRWFRLLAVRAQLPGISAIVTHTDVTAQRQAERVLEQHATHDPATGLANRAVLEQHLGQMLDEGQDVAAVVVELGARGTASEGLGADVLALAAETLEELFPAPARVGRWGPRTLLVAVSGAADETLAAFERIVGTAIGEILAAVPTATTARRIRAVDDLAGIDGGEPARQHG